MAKRSEAAGENEQRYYDTLKQIARGYQTADQLRRRAGQYGLDFTEELAMAYDNIQFEAANAIHKRRRPKRARPTSLPSETERG